MRDYWAERLLATILNWAPDRIATERPIIQALAEYKYNEYQQFSPGMHFIESLALWLGQFEEEKRPAAYEFVRRRLLFISSSEVYHLVSIAYPDIVLPKLIRLIATETRINPHHVGKVVASSVFKQSIRQCLFAGLSDGAHIGVFRRVNRKSLTNEQVLQSHEITKARAKSLREELGKNLKTLGVKASEAKQAKFTTVVFLDDFSGSGMTCLRKINDTWTGKVAKFFTESQKNGLVDKENLRVLLVLYVASQQARDYLSTELAKYCATLDGNVECDVCPVHLVPNDVRIDRNNLTDDMAEIQAKYFDGQVTDKHILIGGTNGDFGYADGALPLVLGHNTPNNSISLLWAYDHCDPRGLFPRVSRHLEQ
jgi:hypothetical protein